MALIDVRIAFRRLALLLPLFAGSSATTGCGCSLVLNTSMIVDVRDAGSGEALPVGSMVTVANKHGTDTRIVAPSAGVATFDENEVGEGRYIVSVRAAGYEVWTRPLVAVSAGRCHVDEATRVTAQLRRGT